MRVLISFIVVVTILSCAAKKNFICNDQEYLITEIKNQESCYIIFAKNQEGNHKIVSKKNITACKNEIEVGKKYCLKTTSIFVFEIKDQDTTRIIHNHYNIDCITIAGTTYCKDYDLGIYDVLISEDLEGLCFKKRR